MKNFWLRLTQVFKSQISGTAIPADTGDIFIFIRCWNRPLFLWACLDSLYRATKTRCKFVLIDNASSDPLVKQVIAGFQRRSMFHAVHFMPANDGNNQETVIHQYRSQLGKYFFLVDSDVCINPASECWVASMWKTAQQNPKIGLLGSCVDTTDFISFETAVKLEPELSDTAINELIKGNSVERKLTRSDGAGLINPFRPPGRLLLVETNMIDKIGVPIGNKRFCDAAVEAGYIYGMTASVIHRHLSLLNIFDYPDYDFQQLKKYLTKK